MDNFFGVDPQDILPSIIGACMKYFRGKERGLIHFATNVISGIGAGLYIGPWIASLITETEKGRLAIVILVAYGGIELVDALYKKFVLRRFNKNVGNSTGSHKDNK